MNVLKKTLEKLEYDSGAGTFKWFFLYEYLTDYKEKYWLMSLN
jgi:hypothetical protein